MILKLLKSNTMLSATNNSYEIHPEERKTPNVTSFFSGNSKSTAWKVFTEHHRLLQNLGNRDLTEGTANDLELFVCKLYNMHNVDTVDKARPVLFVKSRAPESLPQQVMHYSSM